MPTVTPSLWFDDQAEEAAKFYVSLFKGSKILDVRRNDGKVMMVNFQIDGRNFIAFNGGPQFKFNHAISMFVSVKTQKEVDELWRKLLKGGKPIQCGWLTDKFGLSWQIIPEALGDLLGDTVGRKPGRVFQAMMKMVKIDINKLKKAYAKSLSSG